MLRKKETLSRLLLGATVLASVLACQADGAKNTSDQIVGPVAPTGIAVSVTSSRGSLTASSEGTATITARAIETATGAPVPNFTNFTISTTLGTFDSLGGANAVTLPSTGGVVTTTLYPGDVQGTARITATVQGSIGLANVTIKPAVEVVPPPSVATLTIGVDTLSVSDQDPTSFIGVTATVTGTNLKPFKKAPVQFSVAPAVGLFDSSGETVGDVRATNSLGQASDTLVVNGSDLTTIDAFEITATLTVEGGGTTTAALTVPVTHGPAVALAAEFTIDGPPVLPADPVVQFTDASTGGPVTWAWDLDGDGFADDANIPNPTFDYTGFSPSKCSVNVTLVVTRNSGAETSSITHTINVDDGVGPCP